MPRAVHALCMAALATTGCRLLVELVESDPDTGGDVDARSIDPGCEAWPFAPATLDPCTLPAPSPPLVLGEGVWSYDTNSGALTDPDQEATFPASALVTPTTGPEVRALSVERFELAPTARLRVVGQRPLVLISWSEAHLAGTLDVTSRAGTPAAGAAPASCAPAQAGTADAEGSGGGGGGSHGAAGARGGNGNDGAASGGAAGAIVDSLTLSGGCAGANGGNPLGGAGGPGGGAVYVAAHDQLQLDGAITAGGAGGAAAQGGRGGGGGGGAGGFIGLAAPAIVVGSTGVLAANGGGGGGGSDGSPALPGQDGQASATAAAPGAGQGMGGPGGAGAAGDVAAATAAQARRGAGGGGGGVGRIIFESAAITIAPGAVVSPPAP